MINEVLWEQLKNNDVRGECFAPHLALTLKSEWHKLKSTEENGAKHSPPFLLRLAALRAKKQTWCSKYDKI